MWRESPEETGRTISFTQFCYPPCVNTGTIAVPSGMKVTVLARTLEKATVGGATNYWYLVQVEGTRSFVGPMEGWMFGEFINLKE